MRKRGNKTVMPVASPEAPPGLDRTESNYEKLELDGTVL